MNLIEDAEAVVEGGTGIQAKLIALLAGVIVLSLACLWVAHYFEDRGRALERAVWVQKQAAWEADKLKLVADNEAKIAHTIADNEAKERKTSELHEQEVARIRDALDTARSDATHHGGLRISASVCTDARPAAGSTEAPGTSGRDALDPATVALPQGTQDSLWAIVNEAEGVASQLRACQGWIRLNGFYGEESQSP